MDESLRRRHVNIISSTCDNTRGISCLRLLELTAGVGVCDAVLVLVRSRLSFHWGVVHWGVVDWCLVCYHWCSVHHRGGVHQRSMVDCWRMVDWCVVDGGVVDWTGVVERGVVNAMVASISLNSVAVLGPLLLLLIEHHAFERFWSVVCHGSPLQIEVEGWEGVVKLVTHLVPAMGRSLLLLLLLTSNHPEGKKCNAGLKMKLDQLGA